MNNKMLTGEELDKSLKDLLRDTFEKGGKIILPVESLKDAVIHDIKFGCADGGSLEVVFPLVVDKDGFKIGFEWEEE